MTVAPRPTPRPRRLPSEPYPRGTPRAARGGPGLCPRVLPLASAIQGLPAIPLAPAVVPAFLHGQAVSAPAAAQGVLRVYASDGGLLGLGVGHGTTVKPDRLLHADPPRPRVLPG